jgi:putrescine transport system ATP-binding protein
MIARPPKPPGSEGEDGFLRVEGVVKRFGPTTVVDHLNLSVRRREVFALLGSSGCGKTTLLRMMAGLETPSAGRIVLDGQDITHLPPYQRPVNMMFQSYALFPHMTVEANVAYGLKREGVAKAEIAERVADALELVQMRSYARHKPSQLSGGQQQRVALARSLVKRPKLLLLDEPMSALDKKIRQQTQFELGNILYQVGVTCVMVTHDQEEAMTMASRIAVMSEGRFLQVGAPADIYETPATRFVADFIGNVNLMDGTLAVDAAEHCEVACADVRHYIGHGITGTQGMPVSVAVRPEKIKLSRAAPADVRVNAVKGRIREMSYFGSFTVFHLTLPTGASLKVSQANTDRHPEDRLTWNDEAWATWDGWAQVVLTQ